MIFYEVEDGSNGHFLVGTQAEARTAARERKCTWAQVDVPTDKAGLMDYINQLKASAGDPAEQSTEPVGWQSLEQLDAKFGNGPAVEGYTEKANRFEDEFDVMPLALQFHYAARAMENARERL
jgi:hypothetical protein